MTPIAQRHLNRRLVAHGFTLLELLVAIAILAFVSIIAWRGLDSLVNTRARLEPEGEAVRALLTVFGQVERDLAHTASPSLFALAVPAVRVQVGADGQVLELVRIAPRTEGEATAVQIVMYRVTDGVLWRRSSPPAKAFGAVDLEKMSNVQLLGAVKSLRVRVWRDQQGWSEFGAGAGADAAGTPGVPATPLAMPPGLEFTIERNDGKVYRRVVLVG